MRILLVGDGERGYGGWRTYATNLRQEFLQRGHTVESCTPPRLPPPLRCMGNPFLLPSTACLLRRAAEEQGSDIIHIVAEPYLLLVPFLPRMLQQRTVLTVHGSYGVRLLRGWWRQRCARLALRRIAHCITVSNYTKRRMGEELHAIRDDSLMEDLRQRTTVIPNGITIPPWQPQHSHRATKQILLVGGIKPRKGICEALAACAAYRALGAGSFHFTIVGTIPRDDAYVAAVSTRIAALHLESTVTLAGTIHEDDLAQLYRNADLFLMPAKTTADTFEGYGIAYLEANAYGIPCIGPVDSGAAEAVAEGRSGYRVNPTDANAIAERMHWILDEYRIDPHTCRQWAEEHTVGQMGESIEKIYTHATHTR